MLFAGTSPRRLLSALSLLALIVALGGVVSACATSETPEGEAPAAQDMGDAEEAMPTEAVETEGMGDEAGEMAPPDAPTLELAYVPGWDEGVAVTFLWKNLLEEAGYEINLTQLEIATLYAGLANDDIDVYLDGWLPGTHDVYMEQFGEDLVMLQKWYEPAGLYLTVPAYVEGVDAIGDLADNAEPFDSRIVGIEAGAGMMGILRNEVMPTYGLEDWELVESSTPAMLAELDKAIQNEEPIVVTLWSPGWWYGEYDLKNLEDPEIAWGEPDQIWVVTSTGFASRFPQIASWLQNFQMEDEPLSALENVIRDYGDGQEEQAVEEWLADPENRALAEGWIQ